MNKAGNRVTDKLVSGIVYAAVSAAECENKTCERKSWSRLTVYLDKFR